MNIPQLHFKNPINKNTTELRSIEVLTPAAKL